MSRKQPGKTRKKLAEILREALPDVDVRAEDLVEIRARSSTDARADVFRWEAITRLRDQPNVFVIFGSCSTMTECVKRGILTSRKGSKISVEVAEETTKSMAQKLKGFRSL